MVRSGAQVTGCFLASRLCGHMKELLSAQKAWSHVDPQHSAERELALE